MKTILKTQHNHDDQHAGKVFSGIAIEGQWLAVHFNDGSALLFEAEQEYDDAIEIHYRNSLPGDTYTKRGLRLIEHEEFMRHIGALEEKNKTKRRAEYEKLKAEFEGDKRKST